MKTLKQTINSELEKLNVENKKQISEAIIRAIKCNEGVILPHLQAGLNLGESKNPF